MASTADLCKIITDLGGDPEALSDKLTKTLEDEIIRILGCGSCLHLGASSISYGENSTVKAALDSLSEDMAEQQSRVPTAAEVLAAIQSMTAEQIAAVNAALSAEAENNE